MSGSDTMAKNKKLSISDELSDPKNGWRLLRLTPSYREACDVFFREIEDYKSVKGLKQVLELIGEKLPTESSVDDFSQDDLLEKLKEKYGQSKVIEKHLSVLIGYRPYEDFILNYGDVISIPIHYSQYNPDEELLNHVWRFRPLNFSSKQLTPFSSYVHEQVSLNRTKSFIALELEINTGFSQTVVGDSLEEFVKELYLKLNQDAKFQKEMRLNTEKLDLKEPLKLYLDVCESLVSSPNISLKKISELFHPSKKANTSWAQSKRDTSIKLLKFFHRKLNYRHTVIE